VKRLLDQTPKSGQRMLFSATLDGAIDVLVKRYLSSPVVHSVDSASSPVATMTHHVLHVDRDARLRVIADLSAAPGRTVVFTRTKHGAKALARQLNARGVSAVELHGNLSQGARTRNLGMFSDGTASTLVATDIAARGIHVDDVALVVHADPPVEHKAYLHRSGRTARAGAAGTVVTMMLDSQTGDVRDLTRKAGIKATITKVSDGHPLLTKIAPGERTFSAATAAAAATTAARSGNGSSTGSARGGSRGRSAGGQGSTRSTGSRSSGGQGGGGRSSGARRGKAPTTATAGSGRPHSAASFSQSRRAR
jgi:superfamily II DNA/RNA helicase